MNRVRFHKVFYELPSTLSPDSVYYVRRGLGYDTYITSDVQVGDDGEVTIQAVAHNNPLLLHSMGNSNEYGMSQSGITNVVGDVQGMLEAINNGSWDGRWNDRWNGALDGKISKVDKEDGKSLILDTEIERLSGIESWATKNSPDEFLLDRDNHTGLIELDDINADFDELFDEKVDKVENKELVELSEISKLRDLPPVIEILDRSNHSGTQGIETIIDLSNVLGSINQRIFILESNIGDMSEILDEILGETP